MKIDFAMRLFVAAAMLGAGLWGQESRAVISGTVIDPHGAAVPAAAVEVRKLETNVVTKTITNDHGVFAPDVADASGGYLFSLVLVGSYSVASGTWWRRARTVSSREC